jgi:hypothetical protein
MKNRTPIQKLIFPRVESFFMKTPPLLLPYLLFSIVSWLTISRIEKYSNMVGIVLFSSYNGSIPSN